MGRHGVLAPEHLAPQPFVVDLSMAVDLRRAGETDALEDTVDYGAVFAAVREIVEGPHADLIEALAARIARAVLDLAPPVREVTVRVRKPEAPLPGDFEWAGVEITRGR